MTQLLVFYYVIAISLQQLIVSGFPSAHHQGSEISSRIFSPKYGGERMRQYNDLNDVVLGEILAAIMEQCETGEYTHLATPQICHSLGFPTDSCPDPTSELLTSILVILTTCTTHDPLSHQHLLDMYEEMMLWEVSDARAMMMRWSDDETRAMCVELGVPQDGPLVEVGDDGATLIISNIISYMKSNCLEQQQQLLSNHGERLGLFPSPCLCHVLFQV